MQNLFEKMEKILIKKFPNKDVRDQVVLECGQILLLETTNEILKLLDTEDKRINFGKLLNENKTDEAIDFAIKNGINVENILEEISTSLVTDLFS